MILSLSDFIPLLVLMIPVSIITMVYIAMIARMIFRQRAMERVMRARIAAVQRGADPAQLPMV